jgi:alkylhydroperoxidase family enzyme
MIKDNIAAEDRDRVVAGLQTTPVSAPGLGTAEIVLLAYADALTLTPAAVTREHIHALRAVGYEDRAIHDACAIVAYFAFVNRIADGLGVQLERHD